jgi:glutamate dehydrogenase
MKLIINEHGKQFGKLYRARLKELKNELKLLPKQEAEERLLTLAEALFFYSHSQALLKMSAGELLECLQAFLHFLASRDEPVRVALFTPQRGDTRFILVNSPDVPFLVDTLKIVLRQLPCRAVVMSHPTLTVKRSDGKLEELALADSNGDRESLMLVRLEDDPGHDLGPALERIRSALEVALVSGRARHELAATFDRLVETVDNLDLKSFLGWLMNGNFVCFGHAVFKLPGSLKSTSRGRLLQRPTGWLPGSLLVDARSADAPQPTGLAQSLFRRKAVLVVEELDEVSPVYSADNLVCIGLREEGDRQSRVEHLLVGLFSQNSVNELVSNVASLKDKLMSSMLRLNVPAESYDYRKLIDIFNTFPKAEMFFLSEDELDRLVQSFVSLQREQSVKLVAMRSLSLRGVTLLAVMPRDYYSKDALRRMEGYLCRFLDAEDISSQVVHFYSDYVSLHFRIMPKAKSVTIDIEALQKVLTDLARPWEEKLRLLMQRETRCGTPISWSRYEQAFPPEYRDMIHPRFAIRDVRAIEKLLAGGGESFDLWGPFQEERESFRLHFYSLRESCLNELMPFLENLSLTVVDEVDFVVNVEQRTIYIKSFTIRNHPQGKPLAAQRDNLLQALNGLRRGSIEDDYLNRLLVLTGLDWQQIDVFRAYRNYYFQLGNPFTKRSVAFALIGNPEAVQLLYRYFEARFSPNPSWHDPLQREEQALMPVRMQLAQALDQVKGINEDRILRTLFNLIDSTVRTNFFLRRSDDDYFLSFKISAIGIMEMPFPRPLFETYVHSATMEGIHLRGGMVARGGIRWSDRPDDFRTEILGLMKTQMTKNALIVPVGSKGGFVVKTPYTTREEGAELSRRAYITLMRGLLDLVDNRVAGDLRRPPGVEVYDDPDPYLVVAADKGTAHLPDTANSVSLDYGFWLGDAFASGGSVGFDHKTLGITARGAWECVKRHFRELGKDIQSEDFSVVGIGDMSGDVFGNGMLLSKHICLLAAFNHLHIFIDPTPDAARSWKERKRLFSKPRSSWADYNPELISSGGGVFERSSKEIPLSPEVQKWLGVHHATMEGDELIRRLLLADIELLWNGGIGTYVKASSQKNDDVGDRANDNVRVNGNQLRARVVGEGGNLGMTQAGRIEYALAGGRLNTDAIDNSAGVDTSDHEVNLKIFYRGLLEDGVIKTVRTRDRQLHEIQDIVCDQVLQNNYTQSQCLSLDLLRCQADSEPFIDLAERLANAGLLDRQGEGLPSRKELVARGAGYQRPELAILLAYSKMNLYQKLLESDLPERDAARSFLLDYFPEKIRKRYRARIDQHPLRREIVATMITNRLIDQAGCAFLHSLVRQAGTTLLNGVEAYLLFDEVLGGAAIRAQVALLDNRMPTASQYDLLLGFEKALAGLCRQAIEQDLSICLESDCINGYRQRLATFRKHIAELLPHEEWQLCSAAATELEAAGMPEEMAAELASLRYLVGFLPAVSIVEATGAELLDVTTAMGEVRRQLQISQVMLSLDDYVAHDRWDKMALDSLRSAFIRQAVELTRRVVAEGVESSAFLASRRQRLDYYLGLLDAIRTTPSSSTSPYVVLLRALEAI